MAGRPPRIARRGHTSERAPPFAGKTLRNSCHCRCHTWRPVCGGPLTGMLRAAALPMPRRLLGNETRFARKVKFVPLNVVPSPWEETDVAFGTVGTGPGFGGG